MLLMTAAGASAMGRKVQPHTRGAFKAQSPLPPSLKQPAAKRQQQERDGLADSNVNRSFASKRRRREDCKRDGHATGGGITASAWDCRNVFEMFLRWLRKEGFRWDDSRLDLRPTGVRFLQARCSSF